MNEDLAQRLRRLGVGKGKKAIKPAAERRTARKVESLISGHVQEAAGAACFVAQERYPVNYQHGALPLNALLSVSTKIAARFAQVPSLAELSFEQCLFLDTETTGLSGGTGTIAFLVGVGYFEREQFVVKQYFLRNPGDELALLALLADDLASRPGLVSFNGRSFDLPLLETRYILNRRPTPFTDSPHLDLLHPARRLWRTSLESCRLIALEQQVLGVYRDQADVPGGIIPLIYRDYLRSGNGVEMPRIFYHNRIDVLSMVSLTALLCQAFSEPDKTLQRGQEWLSLGRWYERLDMAAEAESAFRRAIQSDLPSKSFQSALFYLARLLKRAERRSEAAVVWQQLAAVEMDQARGHVELAKYHEWHTGELEQAGELTRRAINLVDRWGQGMRALARPDLEHRLARLERKLGQATDPESGS